MFSARAIKSAPLISPKKRKVRVVQLSVCLSGASIVHPSVERKSGVGAV